MAFLRFVKLFEEARSIQTIFALLELVDLFINKNNPREIVRDEKVRKEMMNLINIYNEAFAVCTGKAKIHCDLKKVYEFSAFTPLPSTIFDCYLV